MYRDQGALNGRIYIIYRFIEGVYGHYVIEEVVYRWRDLWVNNPYIQKGSRRSTCEREKSYCATEG